jgi:hypothetical protein
MSTVRRVFGGLALASMAIAVGNANTMVYYTNMFYPSQSGTVFSSATPLTSVQLQSAANGATLYCTGGNGCAQPSGFSTSVSLPKFDQTVDAFHVNVLDSAQFAIGWAALGAVDVTNTNLTSQSFNSANSTVPLTLTGPSALTFLANAMAGPYSGTVPGATTTFSNLDLTGLSAAQQTNICNALGGTLTGGNNCSYPSGTQSGTIEVGGVTKVLGDGASAVLTSGLGAYEGLGVSNLNIAVNAGQGQYSGSSVAGVSFGGSASAAATLEIIYNYHLQAIPEPVTMSLVGGALIGLAAFARRRKKA